MAEIVDFPLSRAKARPTTLKVPITVFDYDRRTGEWRAIEERVETIIIELPK